MFRSVRVHELHDELATQARGKDPLIQHRHGTFRLTHSLTLSTYSLTHSLYLLTYLLTHSLTNLLTDVKGEWISKDLKHLLLAVMGRCTRDGGLTLTLTLTLTPTHVTQTLP